MILQLVCLSACASLAFTFTTPVRTTPRSYRTTPGNHNWNPPRQWHRDMIPDPQRDLWKCGRNGKRSFVCDPNNLLSEHEADTIDQQIQILRHSTGGCRCGRKCPYDIGEYGGFQATVVIIPGIVMERSNPSRDERRKTISKYAEYLRDEHYEHGYCNDDLLIIVAMEDRLVFTATGEEVSPILNNYCVDQIYQQQKDYLSNQQWVDGINSMLHEYTAALNYQHACNNSETNTWMIVGGCAGGVVVIGGLALAAKKGKFKSSGNGGDKSVHYHSASRRSSNHSAGAQSGGGGGDF